MKYILPFVLLCAGCGLPVQPAVPPAIDEPELYKLGAWVSFETATHDPGGGGGGAKLKVGDKCPDCAGTGRIGDGVIENPCERCRATGKVQPGDPELATRSTDELWLALERYR